MSKKLRKTNLFAKDVSSLLYSYGDVPNPLQETVQCLDELVSAYLVDICTAASLTAQKSQRHKLRLEDFRFAIRNDSIKLARAEELIATNKLITEAKKQFNDAENQSLKRFRDGKTTEEDEEGATQIDSSDEEPKTKKELVEHESYHKQDHSKPPLKLSKKQKTSKK